MKTDAIPLNLYLKCKIIIMLVYNLNYMSSVSIFTLKIFPPPCSLVTNTEPISFSHLQYHPTDQPPSGQMHFQIGEETHFQIKCIFGIEKTEIFLKFEHFFEIWNKCFFSKLVFSRLFCSPIASPFLLIISDTSQPL